MLFVVLKPGEHIFHAVVKYAEEALLCDILRQLHAKIKPLGNKPDDSVGIEFNNKVKILTVDIAVFAHDLRKALYAALQTLLEKAKHIKAAVGVIDIERKGAIIGEILEKRNDVLMPMVIDDLFGQDTVRVLLKDPFEQIIDIIKMIVKGLPVDAAYLNKILNGYFIHGLDCHHLLECCGKCILS